MKKKILAKGEKIKKSEKIESIYNFLDENNYPYLSFDEGYREKKFEIDYKGIKLIVSRSNNMDANDEELTPNTFDYYILVNDREIRNSAKDIPKILDYLKSKYADGGSILLAPNGKPSNLTPEQWHLVRTPAFKAWFGDWINSPQTASKVLDENGEPLVCNHSSRESKIDIFYGNRIFRTNKTQVKPIWFTYKEFYEYADGYDFTQYKCFLNIRKLFDFKKREDEYELKRYYIQKNGKMLPDYDFNMDWDAQEQFNLPAYIYEMGYNGYAFTDEYSMVVFEPNQIKLADGTNTTFDSNNPDIRYAKGGTTKINLIKTYLHHEEYSDTEYLAFGYKHNRVFAIGKNEFTQSFMKETIREYYNNVSIIKFGKLFRKHIYPYFSAEFNKERIRPNFSWKELSSYIIGDGDYSIQHEQFLSFCKEANINLPKLADTTFDSNNPDIRYNNGGLTMLNPKPKLLAPNGKPSNLTPEQYRLVRTPAFKAWFGDWEEAYKTGNYENVSKVIDDENGEPLVVYHGTDNSFNMFSEYGKTDKGWYGLGFYFTPSKKMAKEFTSWGEKENILECFLNIRKIYNCNKINPFYNNSELYTKKYIKEGFMGSSFTVDKNKYYHEYCVFYPFNRNIKLADGTNTTFDSNNPDIRYDKGGEVFNNLSDKSKEIIDANYEGRGSFGFYDFDYNKESERENYFEWLKDFKENQFKKNLSKVIKQVESDIKLKKEKEKYKIKLKYFEELIIPSLGNEVLIPELSIYEKQILLDPNATIESIQKGFIDAKNIIDEDGSINQSKITPSNFIVDDEINLPAFEKFVEKNPQYKNVFNDWKKMLDEYMYLSIQKTYAFRYPSVDDLEYLHYELVDLKDKKSKDKFNTGGEVYKIKYADGGYLSETLTIDEVENLLGRKLHWWNDDTIILGNVKYKKIYLQPLYEKVI